MHSIFGRLCCQPTPKRKRSIQVASPSSVIPTISPPAPPPSRAQGTLESEQTDNIDLSAPESAAEINQRLRSAGHTPGPLDQTRKSSLLKTRTSLPDVNEHSPDFSIPRIATSKSWSNQPNPDDRQLGEIPATKIKSSPHSSLGGEACLMTEPSQKRYSEDVADRNIKLYGGIERSNSMPNDQKQTSPDERDRFTRRTSIPPFKTDQQEVSEPPKDEDVTPKESEGRILMVPDLGQVELARYAHQPSAWQSPDGKPVEFSNSRPIQPVREESEESFNTFLRTTGPVVEASKDSRLGLKKDINESSTLRMKEGAGSDDEQPSQRKVSVTPSVGVSRYSTAKASLPEDGDDDDAAEADRVVIWKGFSV
ncbi:hypothetical protein EJ05DRAFT_482516 [Pseudovirgaria hyperparasitica]|uniref:Uncharacterized protein n=1 Tax=Pseudovirgaria hyperparasitica TaxID=470096 RepID=A0A6A6WI49_9PEZI|nr:uncharacterized protein EJ05DRAFT_482516 [Pseudovirgaria hyperparasitica]KAF2761666.1 hypothetical protein EJ05DRAFT_482516 [Pseudovirgaria hyperparasitica]